MVFTDASRFYYYSKTYSHCCCSIQGSDVIKVTERAASAAAAPFGGSLCNHPGTSLRFWKINVKLEAFQWGRRLSMWRRLVYIQGFLQCRRGDILLSWPSRIPWTFRRRVALGHWPPWRVLVLVDRHLLLFLSRTSHIAPFEWDLAVLPSS